MMNRRDAWWATMALGSWSMPAASSAQAAQPAAGSAAALPVAAFFGKPLLGAARLSPNGTKVAMTVTAAEGGRSRLAVLDLGTMKSQAIAAITDSDIEDFWWVNDDWLVFDTSTELVGYRRLDFGPGLYRVDSEGRGLRELVFTTGMTADDADRGPLHWSHSVKPLPSLPAGDDILLVRPEEISAERVGHFALRWLNVRNRGVREVEAPPHAVAWAFDPLGRLRAVVTSQGLSGAFHWRTPDGLWQVLRRFGTFEGDGWIPLFVDIDERVYVLAGHQGRSALFTLDPVAGKLSERPLAAHPQFDLKPSFVVRAGRVAGLRYTIDAEITQWLDPQWEKLQQAVDRALPEAVNRLSLPADGDSPWVLIENHSDRQPYRAFVLNRSTNRLTRLGDSRPAIDARRMGQTDLHWLQARDGRPLPAWLTLPASGPGENLPMVVWVHGGPWVRGMDWRWHAEVQFLASRGYAVLQPEFRGSTGYGFDHFRAGWKQWGQAMQTDLADAARWAIAKKIADPKRIALLGASYGGYATLMGLAQEPELYRAGVAWVAVSDLELMYDLRWSDSTAEWKRFGLPRLMGERLADAAMLRANSPRRLADKIRSPLLLAHGAWDARVPLDHGEAMRDALRGHLRELEWHVYENEGHGWRRPENALDFWQRVERFLARYLAPHPGG